MVDTPAFSDHRSRALPHQNVKQTLKVVNPIKFTSAMKKATADVDAMLSMNVKTAGAPQDAALGALMGVLFGRLISVTPGLSKLVANGVPRDALIGALAASTVNHMTISDPATAKILAPVPDHNLTALA